MTRAPLLRITVGPARVWCSNAAHGNVGDHVGDDPAAVAAHREAIAAAAGLPDIGHWVWLRQVHGARIVAADAPMPPPEADGALTVRRGLPIAIVTADCAPVVVACDDAVAVVHAGHRGLAAGIIEHAVADVRAAGGGEVRAFLGPCIRAARYEFGADDLAPLVARFGDEVAGRTDTGAVALDIPAGVRIALERSGVTDFEDCGVCTSEAPGYFSHRRDGATGRQATIAVLP